MMQLNLRPLHSDILKHSKTYDVFDYTHNGIDFSVLFDVNCQPFKLTMIKKKSDQFLILEVLNGYQINTYLGEDLKKLKEMLELHHGKMKFSTNDFFEEFNRKIPEFISNAKISNTCLSRVYQCEDCDKLYIRELRNWDKYPELKKHATPENREKTRLLYPKIYERIKDKNISVFYTDKKI